jgi:hypothetical protein
VGKGDFHVMSGLNYGHTQFGGSSQTVRLAPFSILGFSAKGPEVQTLMCDHGGHRLRGWRPADYLQEQTKETKFLTADGEPKARKKALMFSRS